MAIQIITMKQRITKVRWSVYQSWLENDESFKATSKQLRQSGQSHWYPEKVRQAVANTQRKLREGVAPPSDGTQPCCPHCQSTKLKRNGRDRHNRQRWLCKGCNSSHSEGADPGNNGGKPLSEEITAIAQRYGISRDAARVRLYRGRTGKTGNEARVKKSKKPLP